MSRLLGIETSCDETAVALLDGGEVVLAPVASQQVHARWGGVVPEIASRLHQKTLATMTAQTLAEAGWSLSQLDGVAVTRGPGLIGALLVGLSYGKGVCAATGAALLGVNHIEAHLWSGEVESGEMELPALALIVSGGHTELYRIEGFGDYRLLGATLDDAAGEAFDKVGGLLGIPYPAGAALSRLADTGDPEEIPFAVARTQNPLDFSFSGLKSAALREARAREDRPHREWAADLAASFQAAVVAQLAGRVRRALEGGEVRTLVVGGGVAANSALRSALARETEELGVELRVPPVRLCTDNATMIAWVGRKRLLAGENDPLTLPADPNLDLVPAPR